MNRLSTACKILGRESRPYTYLCPRRGVFIKGEIKPEFSRTAQCIPS